MKATKGRAMTADNQALLSAIRQIVSESISEAIVPLTERVDVLTERLDALTERSQRIEAEQRDQRVILNSMSTRIDSVVAYVMRLDSRVETIESRMGEIAADFFDMQERLRMVEDRVREGFHAIKSDFQVAFSDIRAIRKTQNRHDTTIAALHDERTAMQQRLSALEGR
jgi:chromosome segregation ATPase